METNRTLPLTDTSSFNDLWSRQKSLSIWWLVACRSHIGTVGLLLRQAEQILTEHLSAVAENCYEDNVLTNHQSGRLMAIARLRGARAYSGKRSLTQGKCERILIGARRVVSTNGVLWRIPNT